MILAQPADLPCADVAEQGDYVTLTWDGRSITLPTLPRPGNYTEAVYLADDGALAFIPGTIPTLVATLACHNGQTTLTLCPMLPVIAPANPV